MKISMIPFLLSAFRIAVLLAGAYVLLVLVATACQRRLIYYPSRAQEGRLVREAEERGLVPWRDARGQRIGWTNESSPNTTGRPAMIVFHGNAGHALHRTYVLDVLAGTDVQRSFRVFLFEYPGYGTRPGRPSEHAITNAASQAVRSLFQERSTPGVYLMGESLGCGVACRLAGSMPDEISGLLLVTPFSSLTDVARHHYPYLPVGWLLRDRYDSIRPLREYRGPVAVILAGRDEIVPAELGKRLYDEYAGPKRLHTQEGRPHNHVNYDPTLPSWRETLNFLLTSHPREEDSATP